MNRSRLYITLNRPSEWQRCLLDGMEISGGSIVTSEGRTGCTMITGSVDSTEHGFLWRSLEISVSAGENTVVRVSAYAADSTVIGCDGIPRELDSLLRDETVPAAERLKLTEGLFTPLYTNCTDGPVGLHGRYIWIRLDIIMLDRQPVRLSRIKLLLKSESMIEYLPEVYRSGDGENGFMTRYLSIFDSIFFDMDGRIDKARSAMDYRAADGAMLRYLADWIMAEDSAYLDEESLRQRISRTALDYRMSGTRQGLSDWIQQEYGVTPNIIEYFEVCKLASEGKDREVYQRLFGSDPYRFFILLPEKTFADTHEANIFTAKLRNRIPAYTEAEVVILKRNVILENHTYLGVNSVIGGYSCAESDSGSIAGDIILGGSNDEQQ